MVFLVVKARRDSDSRFTHSFAVVSPVDGHTKLQLESEGLDIIRSLEGPLSPVVVIGPYRSGKSFLLNQLLGVGCGASFDNVQQAKTSSDSS